MTEIISNILSQRNTRLIQLVRIMILIVMYHTQLWSIYPTVGCTSQDRSMTLGIIYWNVDISCTVGHILATNEKFRTWILATGSYLTLFECTACSSLNHYFPIPFFVIYENSILFFHTVRLKRCTETLYYLWLNRAIQITSLICVLHGIWHRHQLAFQPA